MKTKFIISAILTLSVFTLFAQKPAYEDFDWEKNPSYSTDKLLSKEILKRHILVEFITQDERYVEYFLLHQAEFINSHDEIEASNKRYITYAEGNEVMVHKARVIKPDGKIVVLPDSKFIESANEQTGTKQKYFAFEGIEQGSIIEYFYVIKKYPSYNGKLNYFQFSSPLKSFEFELYAPVAHLYEFNLTNHEGEVMPDTLTTDKNRWTFEAKNIAKLKNETYSPYNALRKQLIYKLDENRANGQRDISSYGYVSQNIYGNIFNISSKESKTIGKFLKKLELKENYTAEEIIRTVENYCKNNIRITDYSSRELNDISQIVKNKMASKFGMLRLLANLLKEKSVQQEIVLTCDRQDFLFDPDFESYHNLDSYLMYFPEIDKYLNPNDNAYRLGIVPFQYMDNYGLFIRPFNVGNFTTGLGEVKYIAPLPHTSSARNIEVVAKPDPDELNTGIDMKTTMSGFNALYLQYVLEIMDEERKDEIAKENFKGLLKEIEVESWEAENDKGDLFGVKPLVLSCKANCPNLIESAGNKLLFKLGELIGPQMEMYNDTARQLPLHAFFKRMYEHKLEIEIPEGYVVKNLDAIKIDKKHIVGNDTLMQFVSNYTMKGNKLVVTISEFYKQISFEAKEVEFYREVVNGASDFNKIVLILEEKEGR